MEQYGSFARRFLRGSENGKWFKTMVAIDRVKAGFARSFPLER